MAASSKSKAFPAVTRTADRATARVGDALEALFGSVPEDLSGELAGARVRESFARAVIDMFGPEAAAGILECVHGVYVTCDDAPRKASDTGRQRVYLDVYITDATYRSAIELRQEGLKLRMWRMEGFEVRFDRLRFHTPSPWADMSSRTPFAARAAELREAVAREAAAAAVDAAGAVGTASGASAAQAPDAAEPWTPERIEQTVQAVENPQIAQAIRRAMTASLLPDPET